MKLVTTFAIGVTLAAGAAPAATLEGGFAGLYANAVGDPDPVDLVVPAPAEAGDVSIGFQRDEASSGTPPAEEGSGEGAIDLGGLSDSLVSAPRKASPQVDVSAESVATRPPDSRRSGLVGADAPAALAYQAIVTQTATPAGLTFGEIPVTATISAFLSVETEGLGVPLNVAASALVEVLISDARLTVGPRATLVASEPDRVDALTAELFSEGTDSAVSDAGPRRVDLLVPVDTVLWVGKRASVETTARLSQGSDLEVAEFEARSFARALVDPIFTFDDARFQTLYAADCAAAGLPACPDADSLFDFAVSPGFANGPAVILTPPSVALLLTGVAGLVAARRRDRA